MLRHYWGIQEEISDSNLPIVYSGDACAYGMETALSPPLRINATIHMTIFLVLLVNQGLRPFCVHVAGNYM